MFLSSPEAEVRALAKERQKKDNHNLSKHERSVHKYKYISVFV